MENDYRNSIKNYLSVSLLFMSVLFAASETIKKIVIEAVALLRIFVKTRWESWYLPYVNQNKKGVQGVWKVVIEAT